MSQFEATIVGKLDLSAARSAWTTFVSQLQKPIDIRLNINGSAMNSFNHSIQNMARQAGSTFNSQFNATINGSSHRWNLSPNVLKQSTMQTQQLRQMGIEVQKVERVYDEANRMIRQVTTGVDTNGNNVRIVSQLNAMGTAYEQATRHSMDFQKQQAQAAKAAQAAQKQMDAQQKRDAEMMVKGYRLSQQYAERQATQAKSVASSYGSLAFDAKSSSMAAGLAKFGKYENSQIQGLQQAREAAAAYNAELQKLKSSYDASTNTFKLPDKEVNQSYTKMAQSAEKYANAMSMVRSESSMMIKDGANITAANQVDAWASRNTRALKKYGDELNRISNQMRSTQDAYELKDLQGQYRNIRLQAQAEGLVGNSMWSSLKQSFGKISAFTGIYALTSQIQQVPIKMVEAVQDINKAQIELRKVSSASDTELESYWDRAADAAKNYGATISDVIQSTADWSRLGYELKDAEQLSNLTTLLSRVGDNMTQESSSKGLQSTLQGFQMSVDQAEHIVDVANEVANTEPIDTAGIFEALSRSSATLHTVGTTYEEAVAMITAANSTIQDPSVVGTAFKTLATRYTKTATELKDMGEDAEGAAETTAKLRDEMKALSGVDILDATGQFKDMYSLYDELADKWSGLDSMAQSRIGELLAGTRQRSIFNTLMSSWGIAEKTLATANAESTQGSATRELENWNKGIEASIEHFKASFQDMAQTVINSDFIKTIVDGGTAALDIFTSLVDTVGLLPTILGGGAITSFFKNFSNFANIARVNDAAKILTGVGGASGIVQFGAQSNVVKALDGLDDIGDVVTAIKRADISDDIAKAAVQSSKWASRSAEIADAMADTTVAASGFSQLGKRIQGTFKNVGKSVQGIGQGLGSFLAANPAVAGAGLTAAVLLVGKMAVDRQKRVEEELASQAHTATAAWEETESTIEGQIEKIRELRGALDAGNLSDEQTLAYKQQIYDIQQSIVDTYGEQAKGIDLVNGSLERQIGILYDIGKAEADNNINTNYDSYKLAETKMTEILPRTIGEGVTKEVVDKTRQVMKDLGLENALSVSETPGHEGEGKYFNLRFIGNVEDAEAALQGYITGLRELQSTYSDTASQDQFERYIEHAQGYLETAQETIGKYQADYESYLAQQTFAKGGGKYLSEYERAVNDYNNALATGTPEAVHKARTALKEASAAKDEFLSGDGKGLDTTPFDNLTEQIDLSLEKTYDFNELLTTLGDTGNRSLDEITRNLKSGDNQFADLTKEASSYVDVIKQAGFSSDKIRDILGTGTNRRNWSAGSSALYALASLLGLIGENGRVSEEGIEFLAAGLANAGITAKDTATQVEESYKTATDTMKNFTEYQSKIASALKESTSATGLTTDSVDALTAAYKHLDSFDAGKLFETTLNGIHLNREELERLNTELEQTTLADLYSDLADKREQLYEAKGRGADTSAIEAEIAACQALIAQYEGLTSAYNDWLNAMSGPKERDAYESIGGAYESMKKLVEQGWYDDESLKSYIDLLLNADRKTGDVVEDFNQLTQSANSSGHSIMDYWQYIQEGTSSGNKQLVSDGLVMLLEDVNAGLGDTYAMMTENGWAFDFTGDKIQQVADYLGTTTDAVEIFARAMGDVGMVTFEENGVLDDIKAAQSYLKDMQDSGNLDTEIDLDFNAKTDSLESLQSTIDSLKEERLDIDVEANPEAAGALDELISKCEQEYYLRLNYETGGALDTAIADVNQINNIINALPQTKGINIKTAISGNGKVQELAAEIAELPPEVQISVGIKEENVGDINKIIGQFADQTVDVGINYKQGNVGNLDMQHANGVIDYKVGNVEKPTVEDEEADINYNMNAPDPPVYENIDRDTYYHVDGDPPPNYEDMARSVYYGVSADPVPSFPDLQRTVTYTVRTVGSGGHYTMATGTMTSVTQAHADGTLCNVVNLRPALANGKVALDENEIALVNELGQESIIRNGQWMLLPPGMHQEALKKGDIVLSADQTTSLLRIGRAAGLGKAHAYGTLSDAYAYGSQIKARTSSGNTVNAAGKVTSSYNASPAAAASVAKSSASTAKSSASSAKSSKEFKETLDEIEILLDRVDRQIESIDKKAQAAYRIFSDRNTAIIDEIGLIDKQVDNLYDGYYRYLKQAESVGLAADWVEKIKNGKIDIENITNEDLKKKIDDYQNWYEKALDCLDTIDELYDTQADLDRQKFDNLQQEWEDLISEIETASSIIEKFIDITEEQGYLVSEDYYVEMIKYENQQIASLTEEREKLNEELANAVAQARIEVGSEEFNSMQQEIDNVTLALLDAEKEIAEFQNEIRQLHWDRFEMGIDWVDDLIDELQFMNEMLDTGNAYDKKGKVTDEGIARFGTMAMEYDTQLQKAQFYADEISKINADLAKDPNNTILIKQRREYVKAMQDAYEANKQAGESMKDLVEEGINKQIDALKDLIDEYTKLLDNNQDALNYSKEIARQQKEIDKYRKQVQSWRGDTSEEGAARRQKTAEELRNAEEQLNETQEERRISEIKASLSDLQDNFSEVLNSRLDDIDALLSAIIDGVNTHADTVCNEISGKADDLGYNLSEHLSTALETAKTALTTAIGTNSKDNKDALTDLGNQFQTLVSNFANNEFKNANATILTSLSNLLGIVDVMAYDAKQAAAKRLAEEEKRKAAEAARIKAAQEAAAKKKAEEEARRKAAEEAAKNPKPANNNAKKSSGGSNRSAQQKYGVALAIINGTKGWGAGDERRRKLEQKGFNYNEVQGIVNNIWGTVASGNWEGKYYGIKYSDLDRYAYNRFARGIRKIPRDQLAITQEKGLEYIMHNGQMLTPLTQGDSVFNKLASDNLWNFANNPLDFLKDINMPNVKPVNIESGNNNVSVSISLPNVTDYASFKRDLQNDRKFIQLIQEATLGQMNGHGKLAKNSIRF